MKKVYVRKLFLTSSTALSLLAYGVGERRGFYDWPSPIDMDEHARHLAPGLGLGFAVTYAVSRLGAARNRALAAGIGMTTLAGSIFETGAFDELYRNTTHSIPDAAWTTLAGVVGAYCV